MAENEQEQPKTIEWYEAQVSELRDIRKAHCELYGDNRSDAYFPDLIRGKLEALREYQELYGP